MTMTNQERLEYIAGPLFKQHIFTGASPEEVQARHKFFQELFGHAIPLGDTGKFTSLGLYLQWYGSGLHNVYQAVLNGNAQVAALTEAVKALASVAPGAEGFDQEAFFNRLQGIVDASVEDGLDRLRLSVDGGDK